MWDFWCGRSESIPQPQPWQGCALPLSYARSVVSTTAKPQRRGRAHSVARRVGQGCNCAGGVAGDVTVRLATENRGKPRVDMQLHALGCQVETGSGPAQPAKVGKRMNWQRWDNGQARMSSAAAGANGVDGGKGAVGRG